MARSLLWMLFAGFIIVECTITRALRISDCNSCLQHCNTMGSERAKEDMCRACLSYCQHRTEDLLRFLRDHQCWTHEQINVLIRSSARRNDRTTAQSCERFHQEMVDSFTGYLIKYYVCTTSLEKEKQKNRNCSPTVTQSFDTVVDDDDDEMERIYQENRNIFMNENDIQNIMELNRRTNERRREATQRSAEIGIEQPVCPSVHEPVVPTYVQRRSERGEIVKLVTHRGQKQLFHGGKCLQNRTIVQTNPVGRCKTVYHAHQAIFKLTGEQFNAEHERFQGCYRPKKTRSTTVICKDWVQIESSCHFVV